MKRAPLTLLVALLLTLPLLVVSGSPATAMPDGTAPPELLDQADVRRERHLHPLDARRLPHQPTSQGLRRAPARRPASAMMSAPTEGRGVSQQSVPVIAVAVDAASVERPVIDAWAREQDPTITVVLDAVTGAGEGLGTTLAWYRRRPRHARPRGVAAPRSSGATAPTSFASFGPARDPQAAGHLALTQADGSLPPPSRHGASRPCSATCASAITTPPARQHHRPATRATPRRSRRSYADRPWSPSSARSAPRSATATRCPTPSARRSWLARSSATRSPRSRPEIGLTRDEGLEKAEECLDDLVSVQSRAAVDMFYAMMEPLHSST